MPGLPFIGAVAQASSFQFQLSLAKGPFTCTMDSLTNYSYPGWFRGREVRHLGALGAAVGADDGRMAEAAKNNALPFGVSEHLGASFNWF